MSLHPFKSIPFKYSSELAICFLIILNQRLKFLVFVVNYIFNLRGFI